MSGEAEVCCATDVLGHGVNPPCETLLFAETQKFDGEERRDLHAWEIAQIAGRAGRFGLVERGHVGVLTGIVWANATRSSSAPRSSRTCSSRAGTWATAWSTRPGCGRARGSHGRLATAARCCLGRGTAALRQWATDGWLSVESIGPLLVRLDAGAAPA